MMLIDTQVETRNSIRYLKVKNSKHPHVKTLFGIIFLLGLCLLAGYDQINIGI